MQYSWRSMLLASLMAWSSASWAQQILVTESFEGSAEIPADWQFQAWQPNISRAQISQTGAADRAHSLHIQSDKANHARLNKTVTVTPNQTYLLSAKIKAHGSDAAKLAAVIGVEGIVDASETVRDDTRWHERQVYIKNNDATSMTILLGLGHFGNENRGDAWFDDVNLLAVDDIPAGAKVIELPRQQATVATTAEAVIKSAADEGRASPWLTIFASALVLAVLSLTLAWYLARRQQGHGEASREQA